MSSQPEPHLAATPRPPLPLGDYGRCDALELAALVRSGEVSPLELVDAALAAIEALNPRLNAVCAVFAEEARALAQGPLPDGPFRGVPFLLKDIGAQMEGKKCDSGSRLFSGVVARRDSELTRRFRQSGVVIVGKSTTPELGAHITTEPVLTGATRNPWSLGHSPGGSSGGSSAACAAGIVPIAHANDGLGSIRIPASTCHLFGLKPTRQRVPTGPDQGETGNGRHAEFIVSKSVRDSAAMLDCVSGADVGAPYWAPPPERPYVAELYPPRRRLRIAVMTDTFTGTSVHADCRDAVELTARRCEALGHVVEAKRLEVPWDEYRKALRVSAMSGIAAAVKAAEKAHGRVAGPDTIEPFTLRSYEEGLGYTGMDVHHALQTFGKVQRAVAPFFEDHDVLLTPLLSRPPVRIGEIMAPEDDFDLYWDRFSGDLYSPFVGIFNVTGQPAASLPTLVNGDGLPVGTHMVARFGRDDVLIALAAELEAMAPWRGWRPPLGVWSLGE